MPLYHSGNVIGDPESGYEYVSRDDPEGVSNYILGKRMVAAISSRLEETALKWWEDYNSSKGNAYLNCWRKNEEMESPPRDGVPTGVVEVWLRDLLKKQFSADVDAREAELELERFMWKPFELFCLTWQLASYPDIQLFPQSCPLTREFPIYSSAVSDTI
ncbi:hypothetical protein BGX38DRAFT_1276732 [Terfezia claveryi]|nr:hypothetical protein BGX38DRAFT_1276732 [Terfezia claveryi]